MKEEQSKPTAAAWWKEYVEIRAWELLGPDLVNVLMHGVSPRWSNDDEELLILGIDEKLGEQGFEDVRRFLAETRPRWPQDLWFVDRMDFAEWERPEPEPDPLTVEFLEESPRIIRRPLSLVDGVAYAVTWPWVQVRGRETRDKKGQGVKHKPSTEQWQVIVRGDGARFAKEKAEGLGSFADLGVMVKVPQVAAPSRLWSTSGVNRYVQGYRPDPMGVFNRVAEVIDCFIDFDRSLADQETMAKLVALFTIGTYFLPAFSVAPYLWSSGPYGVGKTQLLKVICEMAYLGHLSSLSGTFAALRDMSDAGACVGLDDAHKFINSKKPGDDEKLALLLAGSRRGCTVPIMEWIADTREWRVRHVDTFCPRMFSAIFLPDRGLGSRTITIPLIRTLDQKKGNAVADDHTHWPHDRQALVDDLWSLAVAYLPELPDIDREAAKKARLIGRNLDPWRMILGIALWLDEELFEEMEALAVSYQGERATLEVADLTVLVVKALASLYDPQEPNFEKSTADIKAATQQIAEDEELWFAEKDGYLSSHRIGRAVGQLRLEAIKKVNGADKRGWRASRELLEKLMATHGIPLGDTKEEVPPGDNAPNAPNVPNAPADTKNEEVRGIKGMKGIKGINQEGSKGVPLANVGKAQIDKLKLQEGLDAGLSRAEAKEAARVDTSGSKSRRVDLTDLAFGDDEIAENEIIIDGERVPS